MQEKLITMLKEETGGLFLDNTNGQLYHIYPNHIPDGKLPNIACIYNLINRSIQFTQMSDEVQLTIVSKNYAEHINAINLIMLAFNGKVFSKNGDFISTHIRSVLDLDFDSENQYYLTAVNLFVKSKM